MTEKLLQYLWNYKVFIHFDFKNTAGDPVEILDFGKWNTDAGPDFLAGKIKMNGVVFMGNIELHVKSSDWIFHNHSIDPNYRNIILHVVFQHDLEIEELVEQNIPTLELKEHIDTAVLRKYEKLIGETRFIPCEHIFKPDQIPVHFHESNILKKLDAKSAGLEQSLARFKNNFEAVLFHSLAYSFGLKVNAFIFRQIAESIDFAVINKVRQNRVQMEALFFGIAGWLEKPKDEQMRMWKREFDFLSVKFQIPELKFRPKFSRLRPPNFPTLRLSQLAGLYHQHQNLFSKIIQIEKPEELYGLLREVKASEYWDHRFNFGKISSVDQPKTLTRDFMELLILNTLLPLKYTYHKYHRENIADEMISFYNAMAAEKNTVTDGWKTLGVKCSTALESQSLIYHFKHFCEEKNCLNCSIGFKLLKEPSHAR